MSTWLLALPKSSLWLRESQMWSYQNAGWLYIAERSLYHLKWKKFLWYHQQSRKWFLLIKLFLLCSKSASQSPDSYLWNGNPCRLWRGPGGKGARTVTYLRKERLVWAVVSAMRAIQGIKLMQENHIQWFLLFSSIQRMWVKIYWNQIDLSSVNLG